MMHTALFRNIKQSILKDLKAANKEINIAVAWFTNHAYYDLLIKKINEGVKVNLIIINDPINNREAGLDWQHFINVGGTLHFSTYPRIMHHKFCIIDGNILYNGSYNWTYSAENFNRENTVRHTECPELISSFQEEFEGLLTKHKLVKRVRKFSLQDMLQFQIEKAFNFYISKELAANSRWLTKQKKLDLAEKVLTASINFSTKKEKEKLEPVRSTISTINQQNTRSQKVASDLDRRLKSITSQTVKLKTQIVNKHTNNNSSKATYVSATTQNRLQDLRQEQRLIEKLKKDQLRGDFGDLRFNLKWETHDDLDLHVIDPCGNHICYSKTQAVCNGSKGQLDVDANAGNERLDNPQENIFWESNPPAGRYKVIVEHYANDGNDEVPFILTISPKLGKSKTIFAKVHHTDLKTMLVAEIEYSSAQGVVEIVAKKTSTKL